MYAVSLHPSLHNSKIVSLVGTSRFASITAICREPRTHLSVPRHPESTLQMIKGVNINGRQYRQGDHVEYYPPVPRMQRNPTGLGSSRSSLLGTINMFYTFDHASAEPQTFLEVTLLTVVERMSPGLFVIDRIDRNDARLSGFARVPSGETHMVFVDSVVHRVKVVEHFADDALMCALRMWEAR